jgi:ABC-2 type transport system permease protein
MNITTPIKSIAKPAQTALPYWQPLLQEARTGFLMLWRQPAFAVPTMLMPVLFYLMFAIVFARGNPGNTAHYMLATYSAFGVIGPALFGFGAGLAIEEQLGWLRLKRSTPMPVMAMFAAKCLVSMLFGLVVVMLLSATAVMSNRFQMGASQWLGLWLCMALGSLPFCALGLLISSVTNVKTAIAVTNLVHLPMAMLSGLWIPIAFFPVWLKPVSQLLPAYYLGELALHISGAKAGSPWLCVLALLGFSALFLALASFAFRRKAG